MNYSDAIKKLTSREIFFIDLGLERISRILDSFGNPQDKLKYIHIAGTNGKGSVCAMLDAILREAGYKTGLYTSPHIFEYTERIKVSGIEISKEDFANYFEKITNRIEKLKTHLTEFEILTCIMFLYFAKENVDIVILETGMGGRFDATNIIKENLCSIITHIDLDHTDRLGDTKDKIAFEKAGIIKPNCPVITSMGYEAIRDRADELNSLLVFVSPFVSQNYVDSLALKGLHQQENLALAITAINHIFPAIGSETIISGLKKVKNPFRFEYFKDKNMIIDASHNPNGIKALRENLDYYYSDLPRRFVFGCLKTKDYEQMMNILFKEGDEVYLNGFDYPNACTFEELEAKCPVKAQKYTSKIFTPDKFTPDKLNVICGSFYMLKDIVKNDLLIV